MQKLYLIGLKAEYGHFNFTETYIFLLNLSSILDPIFPRQK